MEEVKHFINEFWIEYKWEIIFGVIFAVFFAFLIELILKPFRYWREKRKALKMLYSFTGKSSSLKPKDVLGERPFNKYYYRRREDDLIDESLGKKENVLIIGPPLIGKSRAAYEALIKLNKPQEVTIPRHTNINLDTFQLPKNTQIIFIDDLQRFVDQQNFDHLFRTAIAIKEKKVTIVATCRSSMEHEKVKDKMLRVNIPFGTIFKNIVELPRISEKIGKDIARTVGINWDEEVKVRFDGNVGSIFMRLEVMEGRFKNCNDAEKTILRALRSLYLCGIYEEKQLFPLDWIKIATKKDYEWTGLLETLRDKEFVTLPERDKVRAEEVYLEIVVRPLWEKEKILDVFEEMLSTFSDEPEALFRLGNRAYNDGLIVLEKASYMKIAIKAYNEALKVRILDRFPMDYAMTKLNLGSAYVTLAEVKDKAVNCEEAIKAYGEALKVYTLERFPMDYAMTQWGFGAAYRTLAEVEAKAENCKQGIRALDEALKVFNKEEFPEIYPLVEGNLKRLLIFCGEHTP